MRELPEPRLVNLNPPAVGYRYFEHADARLRVDEGVDSARNRWLLAECALLAYDGEAAIRQAFDDRAVRLDLLRAPMAGGFGYAADLGEGQALLALRGTQVFNPGDKPAKFGDIARDYLTNAGLGRHRDPDGCSVHGGFHRSAGELFTDLAAKGWLATPRRWLVSGHSLGGALAVLLAERLEAAHPGSVAGVLTLGQPRVGNGRHVERLEQLPFRILRIVHGCDAIPSVPPAALDYAHLRAEQVFAGDRRAAYPATVLQNVLTLWRRLRLGIGALSPVALQDHAPLTYVVHCYNAFEQDLSP